jgi:hypothetical protein
MYDEDFLRPLSHADIKAITDYLDGTEEDLDIALSELGFDPCLYGEGEMLDWLRDEAGMVRCRDTGMWHRNSGG